MALNADWASMSAESDYTARQIENAEYFGYDLPEYTITISFGLRSIDLSYGLDGNEIVGEEASLEEAAQTPDNMDMDWAKWDSSGKVTLIALWVGLGTSLLSVLSLSFGALKAKDGAFGSAVILSAISATIVVVASVNWLVSGGGFGDAAVLEGEGMKSDGFGVTTGFVLSLVAGLLLIFVPFILIWSQEIPIDKLLPFGGGYGSLESREYNPSMYINGSIGLLLAFLLVLSGIGQAASSAMLTEDYDSDSKHSGGSDDVDDEELLEYWWIEIISEVVDLSSDTISSVDLENGETRNIVFGGDMSSTAIEQVAPFQMAFVKFSCTDGGVGETGAPIPNDEVDVMHITIIANNGQEFSYSEDCDGESEVTITENENNEDWIYWHNDYAYTYVFHEKSEAINVIEQAPMGDSIFPLTYEITAETKGETLGQNKDNELSIEVISDECEVLFGLAEPYFMGSYYESSFSHTHYNGTSE